jgi:hypothetical protein
MTSDDLAAHGFERWRPFSRAGEYTLLSAAPSAPGVYCMRSIRQNFVRKKRGSDILYIGSAANRGGLRGRLRQYLHPGHRQPTNLRMLARCGDSDEFEIAFTVTTTSDAAKRLEADLLRAFLADHGELPPENRSLPSRRGPDAKPHQHDRLDDTTRLELIAEAVRYCQRVKAMGMPAAAYTKALREAVHFVWERRAGSKDVCAQFRSKAAVGLRSGSGRLRYDHAVPFRFLQEELLALDHVSAETVGTVLTRHCVIALITSDEDVQLRRHGLQHRMPDGWNGADPLARYAAAGIELVSND